MQELMDLLETQRRLFIEAERHTLADGIGRTILLSKQFLEKEKEQIKDAYLQGSFDDGPTITNSEQYYSQTYNQINGIEVDATKSQVTTTGVWSPKTN